MSVCRQSKQHSLGEDIRHLRELRQLGLSELAALTGIEKGNLSKMERDQKIPGPKAVRNLERALGVTFGYLRHPVADALYRRWSRKGLREGSER